MSKTTELTQFNTLRKLVVNQFREAYPNAPKNTLHWSGQDITWFQEDLQEKVHTTISEKWFYTYFKQDKLEKLPRIDMLNLLAQYTGSKDWNSFQLEHQHKAQFISNGMRISLIALTLGLIFSLIYLLPKEKTYTFCFVDKDVNMPITTPLQVSIIKNGQSPLVLESMENGCFTHSSTQGEIQFFVESPYYTSDTITRYFNTKNKREQIQLSADEYALILHYFSTNNVEDWNQRRIQLGKMINNKAVIYQVFGENEFGIDVLSKEAFINKITLPTSSLRDMKIIEIKREEGQIIKLKFAINMNDE